MERTIRVLLEGVGNEATVVRAGGDEIGDPVIVIVIIALVSEAIAVGVQLRAVNDRGAVIPRVLVSIAVTGPGFRR